MPQAAPLYLDSIEAVDRFLAELGQPRAIAIDTEGASFHRFVDRIYLLQLSTEQHHAVIDPLPIGTPERLGKLLQDRKVEVVLHDADYDLRLLRKDYGWQVNALFDTRVASQLLGLRAFGLAALLEQFFSIKLDKKHQRADWSMRPLSADMLEYAALDTRWLLDLRTRLRSDLEQAGRWHWAQEEFERAEGTQWSGDESQAFLKLKGARDLTRRELALLRELVVWRDEIARELDRATFRVAGNEVLLDVARQAPTSSSELSRVKGFPRSMSESRTQGVLDAVRRGSAVPESDLPRFPKAVRWDRDPDFDDRVGRLKAIRDAAAERLALDPGVLCSRDRMEAVARKMPSSLEAFEEIPEMRRWQVEVLGEGFLKSLRSGGGGAMPSKVAAPVAVQLSALPDEPEVGAAGVSTNVPSRSSGSVDDSPYKLED